MHRHRSVLGERKDSGDCRDVFLHCGHRCFLHYIFVYYGFDFDKEGLGYGRRNPGTLSRGKAGAI